METYEITLSTSRGPVTMVMPFKNHYDAREMAFAWIDLIVNKNLNQTGIEEYAYIQSIAIREEK